jgi:hypothetical protein
VAKEENMTKPDQRSVPRLAVRAEATLQMLGVSSAANGPALPVTVVETSQCGMRLHSAVPMNAGQPVAIQVGDAMFLGEVCYCTRAAAEADTHFCLGIVTKECLTGLASLHHLLQALTPELAKELEPRR